MRTWTAVVSAGVIAIATLSGCSCTVTDNEPESPGMVRNLEGYRLTELPYEKGFLILAGSQYPITLKKLQTAPDEVVFVVSIDGHPIEMEQYSYHPDAFQVVAALQEEFKPPIDLLRLNNPVQTMWSWQGESASSGGDFRPASAIINTTSDALNTPGGNFDTVKTTVDLTLSGGNGLMLNRKLEFWFRKGGGVVKREFGGISTRVPGPAFSPQVQQSELPEPPK